MHYMTPAETGKKWGISSRRVLTLAQEDRIPNVLQVGTRWLIPEDAEKPVDARTKAGIERKKQVPDTYRFPSFEYRALSSFKPPLNGEELVLKAATEAYYACRFEEADRILGRLEDQTNDRYLRITALYTGCMTDISLGNTARFLARYDRLATELEEDFPHKAEMIEYIHSIDATLGTDDYYAHEFQLRSDNAYHRSFLPHLANLCAVYLSFAEGEPTDRELRSCELNCILLEESGAFSDLVPLHLYLGVAFGELGNSEKQTCHLRKALALAEKYEIYYPLTYQYYHMQELFEPVMAEFSEDFRTRVKTLSEDAHTRFVSFMDAISVNNIYRLLTRSDYIFLHYAVQGLPDKLIARRLHVPTAKIHNRYREIYTLLGVKSRASLVKLYRQLSGGKLPETTLSSLLTVKKQQPEKGSSNRREKDQAN